jgi:3-hydroxyacyl-CoA dehydrogenase/enoyl-CoA hydratase/3-hydroxybutyryl-CoA epimerase/enoyl-CoA isomerase
VQQLGKTPIVVRDCPGFLVNRIVTPYLRAFVRLVSEGVDPYAIDAAMEAYGWPMGPALLEDVVGLDTGSHVLRTIAQGYPNRMPALDRDILAAMASQGLLGQKSGAGFYLHPSEGSPAAPRRPNPAIAPLLATVHGGVARSMTAQDIVDRMMLPLWLEAARCLDEHVVATAAELDLAVVLGLGYPRWTGGPLQQIDQMGAKELQQRAARFSAFGPEYQCGPALAERASRGQRFHT